MLIKIGGGLEQLRLAEGFSALLTAFWRKRLGG